MGLLLPFRLSPSREPPGVSHSSEGDLPWRVRRNEAQLIESLSESLGIRGLLGVIGWVRFGFLGQSHPPRLGASCQPGPKPATGSHPTSDELTVVDKPDLSSDRIARASAQKKADLCCARL